MGFLRSQRERAAQRRAHQTEDIRETQEIELDKLDDSDAMPEAVTTSRYTISCSDDLLNLVVTFRTKTATHTVSLPPRSYPYSYSEAILSAKLSPSDYDLIHSGKYRLLATAGEHKDTDRNPGAYVENGDDIQIIPT